MKTLEWPKGSGRAVVYDDVELAEVKAMIAAGEKRGIASAVISADITAIHNFKVDLGARLLAEPPLPDWIPPAGSPFHLPDALVAKLRHDGPRS